MIESSELLSIKQASEWATKRLGKTVTASNITYLINYGRVPKTGENGGTLIALKDLANFLKKATSCSTRFAAAARRSFRQTNSASTRSAWIFPYSMP